MTRGQSQIFIGVLFALVAGILFIHAVSLPPLPGAAREPIGPYTWPKFLLGGIFILSVIIALNGIRDVKNADASSNVHDVILSFGHDFRIIIFTVLALAVYVFSLKYTGFILTTWVWLAVVIYCFGMRRWATVLGAPTIVTGILYVTFIKLLFVPLPRGVMIFQTISRMLGH
ncbi:MAG: tripartite tricarboxylate transporter TctB family protein [bacterium]|jgi:putative tricarboxylic transport membrane protein